MAKFGFYSKNDSSQEIVSTLNADSKEFAIKYFATQKVLTLESFNKIYDVKRIGNERTTSRNS